MKKQKKSSSALPENPEWTERDFAEAKRVWEIPELAHLSKRKPGERGPQKAPTKQQVTLRLDRDVVERFRATGPGWQGRINDALKKAKVG
ncbi:MAG: BrnA antitoxin family protein [Alphaproteobacteria bacterium]|nr:BrnA antitoxin family protein [Alphaproteobacteria bacterium]MBN9566572.1 BrnA antitoxin family protein [Alphaproteobacteria bacterium]MBN9577316.1 BrnA antitoxin family protein [Alphaproteobacteria bacterium]MBN9593327.1 BrnA antitoxin family protein [Alphaproteobacteria bacterium]